MCHRSLDYCEWPIEPSRFRVTCWSREIAFYLFSLLIKYVDDKWRFCVRNVGSLFSYEVKRGHLFYYKMWPFGLYSIQSFGIEHEKRISLDLILCDKWWRRSFRSLYTHLQQSRFKSLRLFRKDWLVCLSFQKSYFQETH